MAKLKVFLRLVKEGSSFAVSSLVVNRLRTTLSLLGITIGIFAIISVFTLVDSMERSVRSSFESLGDDAMFIERMPWGPESGDGEYAWWKYMKRPQVTYEEAKNLKQRMSTAGVVSFFAGALRTVEYRNSAAERINVIAAAEGFENFIKVDIGDGRNFTSAELNAGRRVCLLGYDVSQTLFGLESPVGKDIKVGGFRSTVIGVLEKEGQSLLGGGADEWVIIPVTFGQTIMNLNESNTQITLRPKEFVSLKAMEDEAMMHMRSIRKLRPSEEKNFALNKSSMLSSGLDQVFGILTLVGLIIGGFSILVGGFSIANIMFVSVKERTSIIGIQMALGAKRSFILFQFLFEAVLLCLIGGGIGLLIIFLGSLAASSATGFDLSLTLKNVLIGVGFSVVIGLVSGLIPALRASRMVPVDAIRSN
ncbi:MAG: putative ABC transport system permease protein [Flammeovirgaceae bacterium]|jgi:putative ABC transport system permease protein